MKKGYYIYFGSTDSAGVMKKIQFQLGVLNKYFQTELLMLDKRKRGIWSKIYNLLPWVSNIYEYNKLLDDIYQPDFIYIRSIFIDKGFIGFLRDLKSKYSNSKIIIEFPTYPYDKGNKLDINYIFFLKDKYYRRYLKRYADRIATYSGDKVIFGIPTIEIVNGIDVAAVKETVFSDCSDKINLIAVAFMQDYHGYERVLSGLGEYYLSNPTKEVCLYMVGDGPEKEKYENMAVQLGIQDKVFFCGKKTGAELEDVYNGMNIAVSSLGAYKIGIHRLSALKTREYLAKGFPMLLGCDLDIFIGKEFPYYIQFPNDSSKINIQEVVAFYEGLLKSEKPSEMAKKIRKFALENVDISSTMKPIIDYILGEI